LVTHKNTNLKEIVKSINSINEWFPFLVKLGQNKRLIKI
jgi:triphosphoribosyl-dephospho-CoA synthetase